MKQRIEGILWALSIGTLFVAGLGRSRPLLLILAIAWIVSTAAVIPLHFYRAWRRWAHVSNKLQYAAWVGFEAAATAVLISLVIYTTIFK
ncbi:MAG: hypothetical protein WB523_15950 [Candidatus Sulfotelmatobacter sp.]